MGGGGVLCSALVFASISISALRYDGVIGCFAEMVKAITSASRDGFHRHVFFRGVFTGVFTSGIVLRVPPFLFHCTGW